MQNSRSELLTDAQPLVLALCGFTIGLVTIGGVIAVPSQATNIKEVGRDIASLLLGGSLALSKGVGQGRGDRKIADTIVAGNDIEQRS